MQRKPLTKFNMIYEKKSHQKVGIERTFLNIINIIYHKVTIIIILNGEKLKLFPVYSGKWCPVSPLLFNIVLEVLATKNQKRNRIKRNLDWKRKVKRSLFAGDMILYIENPKDVTRKLLEANQRIW